MKTTKKGFTLIELLIVIAIIGILAGVILVSTTTTTGKARTAAGKQTLRSALTYMTLCISAGKQLGATVPGALCNDATTTDAQWPGAPSGCANVSVVNATTGVASITCGSNTVTCNVANGACGEA